MRSGPSTFAQKQEVTAAGRVKHGLELPMDKLRMLDPLNAEWVTLVLLAAVGLMALINRSSPRKWRLLASSMLQMRLGKQALREEMDLQDRAFIGLLVVAAAVLALFGWQAFMVSGVSWAFPRLLMVVCGIILGHYLVLRAVGSVLGVAKGIEEYLYTGFLLIILTGILLLPIVTVIAYRAEWRQGLVVAGGGVMLVLVLYRWLRGAWIGLGEGLPLRYIILYFCAAELLPVLLLLDHWRSTPSPLFNT